MRNLDVFDSFPSIRTVSYGSIAFFRSSISIGRAVAGMVVQWVVSGHDIYGRGKGGTQLIVCGNHGAMSCR